MQTDPIADFLTRVRNAAAAKHQRVDIPVSKLKTEIARILKEEGYISTYKMVEENKARKTLRIFPKGLMTGRAARKANIGGELLCEVW
jgi:small subunit ribosomal protein S8